jgi:RnfABCDGE-type electron transport complex B subunit
MTNVIYAILVLGIMGGVFGLLLAVASKVFAVEKDERLEPVTEALPGANCGGCGFSGCAAYAQAIVDGTAKLGLCTPGGKEAADKIAAIMGMEAVDVERKVALVKCRGTHAAKKGTYEGISDCATAARILGNGPNLCAYGCLGFGSCVKACPEGAISVVDGVARVDHEKCIGCMACAAACPRGIIAETPYSQDIVVACSSKEKGAALRKFCDIGCIGCKLCEKTCEHDAIHVVDNLAQIDYSKCVSCSACAEKCPRHLIADANLRNEFNTVEPKQR